MKPQNKFKRIEKKSFSSNKIFQKSSLDKEFKNLKNLLPNLNQCKNADEVS